MQPPYLTSKDNLMTNQTINQFRDALKSGQICIGPSVSFSDPAVSDALGDSVDFIWIELEHSGMSPEAVSAHLLACRARNKPGLVRLPGGGAARVKPVLDSGADGIILPQVYTVDEVRQLVDDCRYPPIGHRGFGPRVPSAYFRYANEEFVARANESVFVAVMVETTEAYEAISEIVAVPGLDSVVIGPADLSWALGANGNMDDPRLVKAMDTIIKTARDAGVFVGCGMGPDPIFAFRMAARGAQWLQVGVDCAILIQGFDQIRATFNHLRERQ
jgi:2-keto-3-deoxy-L-rhamnonate aldolase RhmA